MYSMFHLSTYQMRQKPFYGTNCVKSSYYFYFSVNMSLGNEMHQYPSTPSINYPVVNNIKHSKVQNIIIYNNYS